MLNFANYSGKETILSKAIHQRQFAVNDTVKCRIFSDMTAVAARRRKEFVKILHLFKANGAQALIAQQSKLRVLVRGKFFVFGLRGSPDIVKRDLPGL